MLRRSARASGLACLMFAIIGVAAAAPVRAACGLTEEAVAAAPVAFVGDLSAVSADGLTATFQVEDVWHASGLQIGAEIDVAIADGGVPATLKITDDGCLRFLVLANIIDQQCFHPGPYFRSSYPWDASYATFAAGDSPPGQPT